MSLVDEGRISIAIFVYILGERFSFRLGSWMFPKKIFKMEVIFDYVF